MPNGHGVAKSDFCAEALGDVTVRTEGFGLRRDVDTELTSYRCDVFDFVGDTADAHGFPYRMVPHSSVG